MKVKNETEKKEEMLEEEQQEENKEQEEKEVDEVTALKETIALLQKDLEEAKHKTLSAQAELINYRKRKDEEVTNMLKYANQDLILEIIQVMDNLERAIKVDKNTISDQMSKFLDGFEMIYASFQDALTRFGVKEIEALGKPFDPEYHMALLTDTDNTKKEEEVLEVLLKGYILKDRVIRPVSVKVNKL